MPPQKKPTAKIIDQITPAQAVSVLRNLWHAYPDFRVRIEAEIKNALTIVDYNEVAGDVESSLDFLDEEELGRYLADLFHESATPSNHGVFQVYDNEKK